MGNFAQPLVIPPASNLDGNSTLPLVSSGRDRSWLETRPSPLSSRPERSGAEGPAVRRTSLGNDKREGGVPVRSFQPSLKLLRKSFFEVSISFLFVRRSSRVRNSF